MSKCGAFLIDKVLTEMQRTLDTPEVLMFKLLNSLERNMTEAAALLPNTWTTKKEATKGSRSCT